MSEAQIEYQTALDKPLQKCATMIDAPYVKPILSTRNLDDLERDLAKLERELVPLLNRLRAMRGKKPIIVPEG